MTHGVSYDNHNAEAVMHREEAVVGESYKQVTFVLNSNLPPPQWHHQQQRQQNLRLLSEPPANMIGLSQPLNGRQDVQQNHLFSLDVVMEEKVDKHNCKYGISTFFIVACLF